MSVYSNHIYSAMHAACQGFSLMISGYGLSKGCRSFKQCTRLIQGLQGNTGSQGITGIKNRTGDTGLTGAIGYNNCRQKNARAPIRIRGLYGLDLSGFRGLCGFLL